MRVFHISMRSVGAPSVLDFPVARGPVPRTCWIARTMARDGPSPYEEGEGFLPPRPRETRRPIASRPGGLAYGDL